MRQPYWEFRSLGVEFVAAANEEPANHSELRERLDLPFMLLSDPDADLAARLNTFHENEPKGRSIARPGMFLIDTVENGNTILWEHVAPTTRHRPPPSRLAEEILAALGRRRQTVSVFVPSEAELERMIASYQDPPLGFYRTPDHLERSSRTQREFTHQLAMYAHCEVHRLTEAGWTLAAVSPEFHGTRPTGHRYVFTRDLSQPS